MEQTVVFLNTGILFCNKLSLIVQKVLKIIVQLLTTTREVIGTVGQMEVEISVLD